MKTKISVLYTVVCLLLGLALLSLVVACGSQVGDRAKTEEPALSKKTRALAAEAPANYRRFALKQVKVVDKNLVKLEAAVKAGSLAQAEEALITAWSAYESMRPAAEALPDQDRAIAAKRSEVNPGEWTGFERLASVFLTADKARFDSDRQLPLVKKLASDVRELRAGLSTLSLSGQVQVRAASHLLSDIERYDLDSSSQLELNARIRIAQARLTGANQLWLALRPAVSEYDSRLVARVDSSFMDVQKVLNGLGKLSVLSEEQSRALVQKIEVVADDIADTAAVFR